MEKATPQAATNAPPTQSTSGSSGVATLANAVVNLAAMRDLARRQLIDILDSVRGKKGLVLDPKLSGPLGLIAEVSLLKEHGVEKIYYVTPGKFPTECKQIVYIVRPKVQLMKHIAENIKYHQAESSNSKNPTGNRKEYYIYFVPRRTMICERVLEDEEVYDEISIGEYALELIPFDDDILSLELESPYREAYLEGDRTSLFYVARSIMNLQNLYGMIPSLKGKGTCAKLIIDMLLRMRKENIDDTVTDNNNNNAKNAKNDDIDQKTTTFQQKSKLNPEIDQLIIIDREVDMITPLCTQLTYEGLIDEIFGIRNSYVDLDPEIIGSSSQSPPTNTQQPQKPKKVKVPLNSNDRLFAEVRDLNFAVLLPLLNTKAKEIEQYYKQRPDQSQPVSQIRDYMKKFAQAQQEHASLRTHIGIAERILAVTKSSSFGKQLEVEQSLLAGEEITTDFIEECINKQEPIEKVLRLLLLLSLTNNGIKPKVYEFFKQEILQTYGFKNIFALNNLEKLGLLKRQEGKNNFATVRKAMQLIVQDIDEVNPNDIAYVYSGYAPLSVRIIQAAFKSGGWRSKEDVLKLLPGPTVEEYQSSGGSSSLNERGKSENMKTLVFFVGGITYTEIAALRWMSQQEGQYGDIIVATTNFLNGDSFFSNVF